MNGLDNRIMMAVFLDAVQLGITFRKWPHHITVVPWFKCNDYEKFKKELVEVCSYIEPFEYELGEEVRLGNKGRVKASSIKNEAELKNLHMKLYELTKKFDPDMNDKFCGEKYSPHVSHKDPGFPGEKSIFATESVFIVDDVPEKKWDRCILDKIELG